MNPDNRVALEHERMTQRAKGAPLGVETGEAKSDASSLDMVLTGADERACEWQPWCRTTGECIKAAEERRRAYVAKQRSAAKRVTAEDRQAYRARHPECVTPLDSVVDALIELENWAGGRSAPGKDCQSGDSRNP